ncbi:unnamed protein product [Heterobilharzia americana]|nr:unnamed protein product [Heterobilharzia americana]CAH8647201.1 unnamed protein product [Heterobilharzia americana]
MSTEFSDNEIVESGHSPIEEPALIPLSEAPLLGDTNPLIDHPTTASLPTTPSLPQAITIPSQTELIEQEEIKHTQQEPSESIRDTKDSQKYSNVDQSATLIPEGNLSNKENGGEIMMSQNGRGDASSEWMPEQHYNVYTCSTVTPSSQSVLQLKQYYTNLEQSTKSNASKLTEHTDHNGNYNNHEKKSHRRLRRNTYDKLLHCSISSNNRGEQIDPMEEFSYLKDGKMRTSVEELRKLFESGAFNEYNKKLIEEETVITSVEQNEHLNQLNRSKSFEPIKSLRMNSVEFRSRPPKFRTPSPKPCQLPTPPPLPLPPSMEFVNKSYEITNATNNENSSINKPKNKSRRKNKNYSSCWSQPAKPILSMSLPYRSRSLALDRKSEPVHLDRGCSLSRYRACSITQRSLSPLLNSLLKEDQINRSAQNTIARTTDGKNPKTRNLMKGNNGDNKVSEINKQNADQSLVQYDKYNLKPDQIVCVNPSSSDGVYVRSAVVYERVNDKPMPSEPKNFITTYVVSKWPSPSQATVQATNLWVAEQSLQHYKNKPSTPFRSQALSKISNMGLSNGPKDVQLYHSSPGDNPTQLKKATISQKDRGSAIQPRIKFGQPNQQHTYSHNRNTSLSPQPLPTPPPTELHPHILRCTSGHCSPTQQTRASQPCLNRSTRFDKGRYMTQNRPYLSRSWSVKSLSPPPPFRSQWLSSMSASRSRQKISDKSHSLTRERYSMPYTEPTCKQHRSREANKVINCIKHRSCVESHRMENARRLRDREKKEWIKRAEEISEDRQKYHEVRGSWSPPSMRSPPRSTPNNMEECTEKEIQQYVRQHSPPARSPHIVFPRYSPCYPQEYVRSLDKGIQCDTVDENDNRYQMTRQFSNNCIDTTPIAEDFDRKRAYFEELIRTNRNLAQCSFYSDCFHCSPGQTPKLSASSSWDSEINNLNSQNNLFMKRDCYAKDQTNHQQQHHKLENQSHHNVDHHHPQQIQLTCFRRPMQNLDYNYHECNDHSHNNQYLSTKYQYSHNNNNNDSSNANIINGNNNKTNSYPFTLCEPQQYASNIYLPFENTAFIEHDRDHLYLDKTFMHQINTSSTKHDYYAKAIHAMPKVAPNPPTYSSCNNGNMYSCHEPYESVIRYRNTSPLRVELEDSPNPTSPYNQYANLHVYPIRRTTHSPPCRFSSYATNQQYNSSSNQPQANQSRSQKHQQQRGDSLESLHCEQNDYADDQPKYYGRVKQIVQALDKQAAEINLRIDSVESVASPDRSRPLRRSHSDRFSYLMPRTSW